MAGKRRADDVRNAAKVAIVHSIGILSLRIVLIVVHLDAYARLNERKRGQIESDCGTIESERGNCN